MATDIWKFLGVRPEPRSEEGVAHISPRRESAAWGVRAACKSIAECESANADKLDLSQLRLADLPGEIEKLAGHLIDLDAHSNWMDSEGIEVLARLKHLVALDLSENSIRDTRHLAALVDLVSLDLGSNGITRTRGLRSLNKLTRLDLSRNHIGDVGDLAMLTRLATLDLAGNRIANIEGLGALNTLVRLDLGDNQLGDIRALSALAELMALNLRGNRIKDVRALKSLSKLEVLNLDTNLLRDARGLEGLTRLAKLDLDNNRLGDHGVEALQGLSGLTSLSLSNNEIGDAGARKLGRLRSLKKLFLGRNRISDLAFLEGLEALEVLDLSYSAIVSGDPALLWRKSLGALHLKDSIFLNAPKELLAGDNCLEKLRDYYAAYRPGVATGQGKAATAAAARSSEVVLNDIKVMIIGNGQVGKTQLRRSLEGVSYDDKVATTHGLEITPAKLGARPLRIWDFGGQDIYLGTHALFLKTRAIFVVAWTPQMEMQRHHEVDGFSQKNYPLQEFARYVLGLAGPNFPVILLQSQCEQPNQVAPPQLPSQTQSAFSVPVQKVHFAARTRENMDGLLAALAKAADQLAAQEREVRLPPAWAEVKATVESMSASAKEAGSTRVLSLTAWRALCRRHGVEGDSAPQTLLELLHNFGTLFHDQDVNADLIIVDQNWALGAIYAIFDRSRGGAYHILRNRMFGRFTRADLEWLVWGKDFTVAEQSIFLDMMRACGVAFILRPATEAEEALWLAPELLPPRQTVERELAVRWREEEGAALGWEREYQFLAPATAREITRRIGALAGLNGLYWEDGVHFYDGALAAHGILEVIRPEEHSWRAIVRIAAKGLGAETLLAALLKMVEGVCEKFGAMPVDNRGASAKARHRGTAREQIRTAKPLRPEAPPMPKERCFVSYAHGDDASDEGRMRTLALEGVLKRLQECDLEPFCDQQHLAHGESITAFMKLGAEQPKFTVILSQKYLHSSFCMDELRRIWRACGSQKAKFRTRVRVVALPGASFEGRDQQRAVRDYWREQESKSWSRIETDRASHQNPETSDWEDYKAALEIKDLVVEILDCVADTIHVRTLDEMHKLDFAAASGP